jgi:hypothetical protein
MKRPVSRKLVFNLFICRLSRYLEFLGINIKIWFLQIFLRAGLERISIVAETSVEATVHVRYQELRESVLITIRLIV